MPVIKAGEQRRTHLSASNRGYRSCSLISRYDRKLLCFFFDFSFLPPRGLLPVAYDRPDAKGRRNWGIGDVVGLDIAESRNLAMEARHWLEEAIPVVAKSSGRGHERES